MAKATITRTLGPIHFEDLDPHRFEDLIRQLVYDFKQWQTIESTGRGGADDGFDIRACEAVSASAAPAEDESEEEPPHPMEGNLWMVQCKREKELGPKRVADIITDAVDPAKPPYGYILAAPANFSKAAHDKFREELRSRGIMEFYLWGAGELEDMLYQPKNDHILFAFFGISLASRRRTRTTEIRATVNAKNKLLRVLGDDPHHAEVLIRDVKDSNYPYEDEYKDFEKRPRWKAFPALSFHPLGLIVAVREYYAYLDEKKSEWDFTNAVNTVVTQHNHRRRGSDKEELRNGVKGFWELLPRASQVMYVWNGLIRFDSILLIDDKGDSEYKCPHIFVDFHNVRGPFVGGYEYLEINQHQHKSLKGLKRVKIFPSKFPKPTFGKIYTDSSIAVDDTTRSYLKHAGHSGITLYDAEDKYSFLKPTDVIGVDKTEDRDGKKTLIKLTNKRILTGQQLLEQCADNPIAQQRLEQQIGRKLKPGDRVEVLEFVEIYDWQVDQDRPVV